MAVSGGIKFFEKSSSLEVGGAVALASSGDSASYNVLNHNPHSTWRSVDSTDSRVESLFVAIPAANITRLIIRDINWKLFDIKYWSGSAWTDFSTPIAETVFAKAGAYYEFTQVTSLTLLRIQITSTQTANQEKRCGQVILTTELGTLAGFPKVGDLSFDRNDRRLKMLTKSTIQKTSENFEMALDFSNYPPSYSTDLDLMLTLWDRDDDFIIWPCGGRSTTTYFKYAIRGFGLNDLYQVRAIGRHQPSFHKNVYINPVSFKISFVETANPEEGAVATALTFNSLDLYAADSDEIVLKTHAFTTTGITRHRLENSDNSKYFELKADFSPTVAQLSLVGGDILIGSTTTQSGFSREKLTVYESIANTGVNKSAGVAAWLDVTSTTPATSGVWAASSGIIRRHPNASVTDTNGIFAGGYFYAYVNGGAGTYTNSGTGVCGIYVDAIGIAGTSAITNYAAINIAADSGVTGTNKAGIKIGNMTGATNNYSILTGTGEAKFGGTVNCVVGLRVGTYTPNTSNPPTELDLDNGIGTNANMGSGFLTMVDDAGGNTNVYLVLNQGTSWYQVPMVKCV